MDLKLEVIKAKEELENQIDSLDKRIKNCDKGYIKILNYKGKIQYVHCLLDKETGKIKRSYIKKDDKDTINKFIQKSYDLKMRKVIEKNILLIEKFQKMFIFDYKEKIYFSLSDDRRKYIKPIVPTFKDIIDEWKSKPYISKGFRNESLEIYTKKGERVRSKSEKILADMFFDNGIEYKYEAPLYLKGYGTIYPDFTFISPKTKQEIYWEHEGMMDNVIYCNKALRKLDTYQKNQIFVGENLIITFEGSEYALNIDIVQSFIDKYIK